MGNLRTQLSPQRRRAVLTVAIAAISLDSALLGLIAPLLPEIEHRIGASDAGLGLALGAYALPVLFVSLPLGRLSDRVGRRPLLLAGMLLCVAGSLLIAFADTLPVLVAGRAVQGVGSAASWIAALAVVSELAPPGRKGEAIGFALAANSVGAIAGPAAGGILGDTLGFDFPFLLVAGIGLLVAAGAFFVLPRDKSSEPAEAGSVRALVRLACTGPVLPATAIVVAGAAAIGLVEVVVPLDASSRLGVSAATIGTIFAATIALDLIFSPLGGRAGDRRGRLAISVLGVAIATLGIVLLATLGGVAGLIVGLSVYGIGSSLLFSAAVPWLDDAFGEVARGFGYGFLNLTYSLGYTVGPIVAGLALQLSGPAFAYALQAAAFLACVLLALSRRQPAPLSELAPAPTSAGTPPPSGTGSA